MKKRTLLGVFLATILMLAMPCMGAIDEKSDESGNIDEGQVNYDTGQKTVTKNIGKIHIFYDYSQEEAGEVEIEAVEDFTVYLGDGGGSLRIEADVHIDITGDHDCGHAKLYCDGEEEAHIREEDFTYTDFGFKADNLNPGDEISVRLYGQFDPPWYWFDEIVKVSKTVNIEIIDYNPDVDPKLDYSPRKTLRDEDSQHWQVSFNVKNAVDSQDSLHWTITKSSAYSNDFFKNEGVFSISKTEGWLYGLESVRITVSYTLERPIKQRQTWYIQLKLRGVNTGEEETVHITFTDDFPNVPYEGQILDIPTGTDSNQDTNDDNQDQGDDSEGSDQNQDPEPEPLVLTSCIPASSQTITVEEGETVSFSGWAFGGSGEYNFVFNVGETVVEQVDSEDNGYEEYIHTYSQEGTYSTSITLEDLGNGDTTQPQTTAMITVTANNNQNNPV